jgi:hypothetical protein
MVLSFLLSILSIGFGFTQSVKPKPDLRMQDFIGINLREGDPLQYANCVGFAREYHEWPDDEGNHLSLQNVPNVPIIPSRYPNNKYAWNTSTWQSNKQYDNWYANLRTSLVGLPANLQPSIQPVCATLKSCSPYISSDITGSNSWSIGQESELVPAQGNHSSPSSYRWYADWVYQFTKKFGNNTANANTFKPTSEEAQFLNGGVGRNRVGYVELWNEPNKYWLKPLTDYKFSGADYAALACAASYGRDGVGAGSDLMAEFSSPSTAAAYKLGVRNADPNMRVVMGGTAGIQDIDSKFITDMKDWFTTNGDATINGVNSFPFDVINLHHYNSASWNGIILGQTETTARSPETDSWTVNGVTKKFKQRLKDIKTLVDASFAGRELWLSEFGFDTNENSPYRTPNITTYGFTSDRQEVQGQWLLRGYMEIAAAGWDRAMQFCIRDENPNDAPADGQGVFKASGLVRAKELGYSPKKSYYYVHSMKEILRDRKFDIELSADPAATNTSNPRIMRFRAVKTTPLSPNVFGDYTYAVWLPTSNNEKVVNQRIYFGPNISTVTANATLVTLQVGDLNGVRTTLPVTSDNTGYFVTLPEVSERPVFFILGGAMSDAAVSTPIVSAVGVSCNAIKASWSWSGTRPNIARYQVYYYEKNDSEENVTQSKAFNISDKNLVLFTDNLSGNVDNVLISGLKKPLDQYYIFIRAVTNDGVVSTINTNMAQQGWTTATTLSCSNNIITGITDNNTTKLFDYTNVKFCYPQDISEITEEWDGQSGNALTSAFSLNDSYIIEGIAVLDGNDAGNITINAGSTTILNYRTEYLNEWRYFAVPSVQASTLQIVLANANARLKKVILYGRKATNPTLLSNCPNCDAVTAPTGLTVIGTNSGSVTNLSTLITNGTLTNATTNKNIRVNGIFNIDADFTFNNYKFSMKPASAIRVNTDRQLSLVSTSMDGCEQMWRGITIEAGGRIEMDKSILRDAEIALRFQRSFTNYENVANFRTFGLVDTRLERNTVGLIFESIAPGNAFTYNYGNITSNSLYSGLTIDGTEGDLKPCYSGQNNGQCIRKATMGMSMSDMFAIVYTGSLTKTNNIKNVARGILAINTYLALVTTKFTNIQPVQLPNPYYDPIYYPYPTYSFGGEGVYLLNGFFNQRGLGSNLNLSQTQIPVKAGNQSAPLTFDNVYQPFYIGSSWFNIYGNKIKGGQQEALYNNTNAPNNYSCYFENNYVSTNADGIKAYGVYYPGHAGNNYYGVQIIDNYFEKVNSPEQNKPVGTGITVSSYAQPANVGVDISRNYIETQNGNGSIGISLWGTLNSSVQNNYVNLQSFTQEVNTGFSLFNNTSATIANNTVEGKGYVPGTILNTVLSGWANNIGMYIQSSPTNTIRCNTFKYTKFGLQFVGANQSTNGIRGNTMDGYYQGFSLLDNLSVAPQPIIGTQTHMGNKWIPVVGRMGTGISDAQHSSTDPITLGLSAFNTDNASGADPNLKPNIVIPSTGWFFKTTPMQGTYSCATNSGGGSLLNNGGSATSRGVGDFEEVYMNFARKDAATTTTESIDASEWVLRRNTLKAIKKLGTNRSGTDEDKRNRDNFAQKHATTSVNDFNDMEEQMAGLYDRKTADDSRLEEVGSGIVKLIKADINMRITPSFTESMQEYYKLLGKRNQKIKADAEQLKAANGRIRATKPYEIYEKQVNDVYLSIIGQSKIMFTIQQEKLLREIAVKCPAEVGIASYKARVLWDMGSREKLPDWRCDNVPPILRGMRENTQTIVDFSVHPNPAQNELTLNFAADNMEGLSWEITNLAGTKMSGGILKNNIQKMDTQQLTNGIYYMTIRKLDKFVSVQKFAILH